MATALGFQINKEGLEFEEGPFGSWERRHGNGNSLAFPCLVSPGMGNGFLAYGKVGGKVMPPS
ncbi:hypothetical protein Pyn_09824 [Prunus yedoensis var. nudiflora]|uniref:Uncharacterized protein n=1 Tax=Prunus yedoensis var. nudiflora TaxID=2094558 RepID=A0A314Y2P3_PRUYE|nr:hypothetical protein Pyn_09824 [Prunus yedoensis var. nudiflora]